MTETRNALDRLRDTELGPSRRSVIKAIGGVGLGIPLAQLGLLACSSSSGGGNSISAVLSFQPDPTTLPDAGAVDTMLDKYKTKVKQRTLTGANTSIDALIAGQVDVVAANITAGLAAVAKGQKIVAAFPAELTLGHMYVTNDKIQDWSDLPGKTFGITSKTDSSYVELALLCNLHGVDVDKIKFISVPGTSGRAGALAAGKIDGGSLLIGTAVQLLAKQNNLHNFAITGKEAPDVLANAYWVRTSSLKGKQTQIQNYANSMLTQYRVLQDQSTYLSEAKKSLKGDYTDAQLLQIYDICKQIKIWDPAGTHWSESVGDQTAQALAKVGLVDRDLPFSQWGTTQFTAQALKTLGPYNQ